MIFQWTNIEVRQIIIGHGMAVFSTEQSQRRDLFFEKKWAISGLFFLYFLLFNTVDRKQMFNINFADDWIRIADLWFCKQPLYQMSHKHCPNRDEILFSFLFKWQIGSQSPKSFRDQYWTFLHQPNFLKYLTTCNN